MSEKFLREHMFVHGSQTIKDYLESYPTKVKFSGNDSRYEKMFMEDRKTLAILIKQRKVIINKGMFKPKFEFDDSQIDDLSFYEMHAIIRNFPHWAAKSPGEKGENYYIRTKMIDKIIELVKYADEVHTGFECEGGEEPIMKDLLYFKQSLTGNQVKEINEEHEAKQKEREEKLNQLKIEMAEKIKSIYENVEGIDKFNQEALEGKYSIGMPAEYLRVIFPAEGEGANKKESVSADGVKFTVEYESLGENSRGTMKYKKEFKVENELIVGWKDIN